MDFKKKFFLCVYDTEPKEIYTFNKGKPMSYKQIKNEIINEMEHLKDEGLALFEGEFYLTILSDAEVRQVYQCILYRWLYAQYVIDTTKSKNAFSFLLDCLFIFGEWTCTYKVPKNMIKELSEQMQKIKDDSKDSKILKWTGDMKPDEVKKINKDTILNGKPLSYWEEKQKEYDRQRLELINKGF